MYKLLEKLTKEEQEAYYNDIAIYGYGCIKKMPDGSAKYVSVGDMKKEQQKSEA